MSGEAKPRNSASEVMARLAARRQQAATPAAHPWREAAAVWMRIDVHALRCAPPPDCAGPLPDAPSALARELTFLRDEQPPAWMLLADPRVAALGELYRRGAIAETLALNPQERARPINALYAQALLGEPPALADVPRELLGAYVEIAGILARVSPGPARLPDRAAVAARRALEDSLDGHRALAAGFEGRVAELSSLRRYVDLLHVPTGLGGVPERIARGVARVAGERRGALVVYGPGGVGKSTLLARFLLDHLDRPDPGDLLFAYLDLERRELSEGRPGALAREAARQMRMFHAELIEPLAPIAEGIAVDDATLVAGLARVLGETTTRKPESRVLLLLDTFEAFQRHGNPIGRLQDFLTTLQAAAPGLRVVVSGRAPATDLVIGGYAPTQLALKSLDSPSAVRVMTRAGLGADRARAVVAHVGTSPLSLQLALDLVRATPDVDLGPQSAWWQQVDEAHVRGVLYTRVLDRIADEAVRRAAHPGMVVRRLDAAVLFHVLDGPCELGLADLAAARALLDRIRAESALVRADEHGGLRFLTPLRVAAVPLIEKNRPGIAARIHELAITHYVGDPRPETRVEELYHRLALGQLREVEARLSPELDLTIGDDIVLLPPASRAFVTAHHLGGVDRGRKPTASLLRAMASKGDYAGVVALYENTPHIARRAAVPYARSLAALGRTADARRVASGALGRVPVIAEDQEALQDLAHISDVPESYAGAAPHARDELTRFLQTAFTGAEVRRLIRYGPDGDDLFFELLGADAPVPAACARAVEVLQQHGHIERALFDRLRQARPARASDIDAVERSFREI